MKEGEALPAPIVPALQLQAAHSLQKLDAETDALPLGQDHQSASPHVAARLKFRAQTNVSDRLTVHKANVELRRNHVRQLQIMMRLKQGPELRAGLVYFERELASSKALPVKFPGRSI